MPPVVLMGGDGGGTHSVPASPIVEMPPSPAPGHDMMFVEFPDDEDDDDDGGDEVDDRRGRMYTTEDVANANIVNEVSNSLFILLPLLLYYYYASMRINKPTSKRVYSVWLAISCTVSLIVCVVSSTANGWTTTAKYA